uniref:Lipase class 3 family protein n=1 Tax=Tetraselmis sp. GSL018 TaxID=582737 RepID=A0A061SHX7_9CHLO
MATLAFAACGTAAAFYAFRKAGTGKLEEDRPTINSHTNQHQAPTNWLEALYFFTETLRYAYSETLGRWRTADLLLGLVYLSRREGDGHPAADIVAQGNCVNPSTSTREQILSTLDEVTIFRRLLALCCVQRLKHNLQENAWQQLGIGPGDVLKRHARAGVLRPAFSLLHDRRLGALVLVVRGTHSLKDIFTCLTSAVKPHHMTGMSGVVLGYSHFGMLAAARWILKEVYTTLEAAMESRPESRLLVVGHSLGGGTAAMLTMMLRDQHPRFASARCYAIACPSCMTLELSQSCASYVTSLVCGADIVPTFSPAAMDTLRTEVAASHWYDEFRQSSTVLRMVDGGLRGFGNATLWTTRQLIWGASIPVNVVRRLPPRIGCGSRRRKGGASWHCGVSGKDGGKQKRKLSGGDIDIDARLAGSNASTPRKDRDRPPFRGTFIGGLFSTCRSRPSPFRTGEPAYGDDSNSPMGIDEDEVQQLHEEITERCEELSQQEENSMRSGITGILQEVAEAEHEEAADETDPLSPLPSPLPARGLLDKSGRAASNAVPPDCRSVTCDRRSWEQKRKMYPAGRILHIVPRSAVPALAASPSSVSTLADYAAEHLTQCSSSCEPSLWEVSEGYGQRFLGGPSQLECANPACNTMSRDSVDTACLDMEQQLSIATEPEQEASMEEFVLFQDIPHQAYGRMKVCRQMIHDHILPSYLEALDSVQGHLQAYLQGKGDPASLVEPLPAFCQKTKF